VAEAAVEIVQMHSYLGEMDKQAVLAAVAVAVLMMALVPMQILELQCYLDKATTAAAAVLMTVLAMSEEQVAVVALALVVATEVDTLLEQAVLVQQVQLLVLL
jgi:hypothetical protein